MFAGVFQGVYGTFRWLLGGLQWSKDQETESNANNEPKRESNFEVKRAILLVPGIGGSMLATKSKLFPGFKEEKIGSWSGHNVLSDNREQRRTGMGLRGMGKPRISKTSLVQV